MITFLQESPHPALQHFVKAYWYIRVRANTNTILSPLAPIPEHCLYFYPKDKLQVHLKSKHITTPDNVITGQQVSRQNLIVPRDYLMFKVIFQPSGLFRLFDVPMTIFADSYEDLALVLGNEIKEVREKIEETEDFKTMIEAVETFLCKKMMRKKVIIHPIDAVIPLMYNNHFSLDKLADDACLSSRQFERKFLERVGVSPKIYQRLIRFNQAMKLKQQFPAQSWLKIAYECGYFDQMHLLRDFKQFTGEIPSKFDFENAIIY
jgi:AraC-like DNA-binding protein